MTSTLDAQQVHPFLICKRSQFPELRQRAERQPWAVMKKNALATIKKGFDQSTPIELNGYVGACALMYILEPGDSAMYAASVRDAILKLDKTGFDPTRMWAGTVPQMGAAFVCILALDIVYDDLSEQDIAACEEMIETCINKIDRHGSWPSARYGTHGTWDIYKGKRTTPDDAYYDYCMVQMTEDGVSAVSPGYAFARMGAGNDRPSKGAYADVLEFTGIDKRYYNNERFKKFYRWLFSCSVTPAKQYHMFGDVSPCWSVGNSNLLWRIGRFDRKAAAYLAWLQKGKSPGGHILSYILMTEPLPDPVVPMGAFSKSAAVFREVPDSPMSLGVMLYCIVSNAEWHSHEEANGISCSAYGTRLLTNGGWLGDPMRPPYKNNTIAINGKRYEKLVGDGIDEGILGDGFDYACGDSGEAIGDNKLFKRSAMLVHGQDGLGGYFAFVDEVKAAAGDKIHSYLQLATESEIAELKPNQEYQAVIDHHQKVDGVLATIVYGTRPDTVRHDFIESGSPTRNAQSGKHWRQEAVYDAGDSGRRNIVTVLFPHDAGHPKAEMSSIDLGSVSGAIIDFGSARDVILTAEDDALHSCEGISFNGRVVAVRSADNSTVFYFARRGKHLLSDKNGFKSSAPVSIHMKGNSGHIAGPATELTLYYTGANGVSIDGEDTKIITSGDGYITVAVPDGSHSISIN